MNKSKFKFLIEQQTNKKTKDYDYVKNGLIKNHISSYIYFNENLQPLILEIEKFMQLSIYHIKYIKKAFNFAIRKDETNFN